MISSEEILNLPEDPKLAFAEYVRLLREAVNGQTNPGDYKVERSFVSHVRAFADSHDVGISVDVPPGNDQDFWDYYTQLNDTLDYHTAKINLLGLRGGSSMNVKQIELSDDYRSQIHVHLEKVRKIVNSVSIEERLRENIFKRLNDLSSEIDKNRSGLMRYADAFIEITSAVADGAETLEPAVKVMERIGGLFGKARKEGDVRQISGGEKQKLITGPADVSDTSDVSDAGANDDEIPF